MSTTKRIEELLKKDFKVYLLEVKDDSLNHVGHPEAKKSNGGHFDIVIVSPDFEGKTHLERHRMIYNVLNSEFKTGIHALRIRALSIQEYKP